MKKFFLLFAVFFLFVGVAWARENSEENAASQENSSTENSAKENPQKTGGWNFSIEPLFGARIGKEMEIVWAANSKNGETYKLSELEWEYTPAWYLGGKFTAGYKRFETAFSSKFFLPTHCGTMKDSDWLQDSLFKTGNTSIKTNYSESENKIKSGQDLELAFAVKFYPTGFLTLRPKISVNYNHFNFNAIGGTAWYGKNSYFAYNSENITTKNLGDGAVIKYNIHNLYVWTGLQVDFVPTTKIAFSLATEAAPLLYMYSRDSHILRKMEYKQYSLSAFYAVRQSAGATFNFNQFFSAALNFSAVLTGESSGPNYCKNVAPNSKQDSYTRIGNAGARSIFMDIGISAKFNW